MIYGLQYSYNVAIFFLPFMHVTFFRLFFHPINFDFPFLLFPSTAWNFYPFLPPRNDNFAPTQKYLIKIQFVNLLLGAVAGVWAEEDS